MNATGAETHPRSLSIVIPVYNEEEILAETVSAVVGAFRGEPAVGSFEVIVVENGSTDETRALARHLTAQYDEVRLIESDVADYGAAMRDGFAVAAGDFIVNFDADYYDFDFARRALGLNADIVVAAKGIVGSHDARVLLRRVVSRSFSLFVRRLLGLHLTETHGMKLFRRRAIEHLVGEVRATKDLFDTELVARAEWSGLTIVELPIRIQEMRHSRSGIVRRIPRTIWGLFSMRYRLRRKYRARIVEVKRHPLARRADRT